MSSGNPQTNSTISTPYGPNHSTELNPPAVKRELAHKRQILINGYVRNDGLFHIEEELTDHKTNSFPSDFRVEVTPDLPRYQKARHCAHTRLPKSGVYGPDHD